MTCEHCIKGIPRHKHADGSLGHEFQEPDRNLAFCDPCKDDPEYITYNTCPTAYLPAGKARDES